MGEICCSCHKEIAGSIKWVTGRPFHTTCLIVAKRRDMMALGNDICRLQNQVEMIKEEIKVLQDHIDFDWKLEAKKLIHTWKLACGRDEELRQQLKDLTAELDNRSSAAALAFRKMEDYAKERGYPDWILMEQALVNIEALAGSD